MILVKERVWRAVLFLGKLRLRVTVTSTADKLAHFLDSIFITDLIRPLVNLRWLVAHVESHERIKIYILTTILFTI